MDTGYDFETARLGLRRWKQEDKQPFAQMNADKNVMRYFRSPLSRAISDTFIDSINQHFAAYGFGLWATELKDTCEFIGFIGFFTATFDAPFTPCTEIGWRISAKHWNHGYATEGAKACLAYGFDVLKLSEIFSFTSQTNNPSIRVMQKIGMSYAGMFDTAFTYGYDSVTQMQESKCSLCRITKA